MEKSGKVKQLSRDDVEFLMDANKFTYRKPLDSSLISTRQMRKYNFTPTNYIVKAGGDTQAEVVINSGSDYVSGPNSYITLTVQAQALGGGAAAGSKFSNVGTDGQTGFNLFKACELIHRSGDQVDYVRELNALVQTLLKYENDDTFSGYTQAMGNNLDIGTNPVDIILPLRYFSGLFAQEALIPSNLIGGMRMRLEFEDILKVLSGGNNNPVQIKITNMAIVLDSLVPIDDVQAELRDAQANVKTQGLQYSYYSYYNIKKPVTSTEIDFNLNFSAGKVMSVILKSRETENGGQTPIAVDKDNIGGEQYPYSRIQARLGSLTFPQHELTSKAEAYTLTLRAFDALDCPDVIDPKKAAIGVSYIDYVGEAGACVVAWDMERSSVLKLSGELTNNSRLLTITGSVAVAKATRVLSCWVKHFRVVNVQLDNVTVDR